VLAGSANEGVRDPMGANDGHGCEERLTCILLGPRAAEIVGSVVGETEQKRAFEAGDVHVGVAGVLMGEAEVLSIWRPEWVEVVDVVVGELHEA
jgi:hypothetical protein